MDPFSYSEFITNLQGQIGLGNFGAEFILIGSICAIIIVDLLTKKEKSWVVSGGLALGGVISALVVLVMFQGGSPEVFGTMSPDDPGMVANDGFSYFFKILFLVGTGFAIWATTVYDKLKGRYMGEYYAIMLSATLGALLLASARDFLLMYLAIELLSIPSFILVVYTKQDKKSSEAGLKYVIYGAVASALMIYGVSFIYGITGSTHIVGIEQFVTTMSPESSLGIALAGFLILAGFAYKMAMVPMHFWAPDVYQGAPTPVTAYLSVVSKGAGVAVFMRFLYEFGTIEQFDWTMILVWLAAITMTVGNLSALFQTNVKRLLAYSSVAHVGYVLMGIACYKMVPLSVNEIDGFEAVAFYLFAYTFMNMGAFGIALLLESRAGAEDTESYKGLAKRAPVLVICMTICLFSLVGLPPTGGFVGKLLLFKVALSQGLYWLVIVAGVNTAISLYYYANIFKAMCLESPSGESVEVSASAGGDAAITVSPAAMGFVVATALGVLILGLYWGPVLSLASKITFL